MQIQDEEEPAQDGADELGLAGDFEQEFARVRRKNERDGEEAVQANGDEYPRAQVEREVEQKRVDLAEQRRLDVDAVAVRQVVARDAQPQRHQIDHGQNCQVDIGGMLSHSLPRQHQQREDIRECAEEEQERANGEKYFRAHGVRAVAVGSIRSGCKGRCGCDMLIR